MATKEFVQSRDLADPELAGEVMVLLVESAQEGGSGITLLALNHNLLVQRGVTAAEHEIRAALGSIRFAFRTMEVEGMPVRA